MKRIAGSVVARHGILMQETIRESPTVDGDDDLALLATVGNIVVRESCGATHHCKSGPADLMIIPVANNSGCHSFTRPGSLLRIPTRSIGNCKHET